MMAVLVHIGLSSSSLNNSFSIATFGPYSARLSIGPAGTGPVWLKVMVGWFLVFQRDVLM